MKSNRFWMEICGLGTATACVVALLLATLGAASAALAGRPESSAAQQQTHDGMVTCSRCGAKHSADLGQTAGDCTRQCVHGGATFALVDGDKTYTLDGDVALLKPVAGQRARIVGAVHGNTIKVLSVATVS